MVKARSIFPLMGKNGNLIRRIESEKEGWRAFWSFCVRMNQLAVPPH